MKKVWKESSPSQPSEGSTASSSKEMRPSRDRAAFRVVGMGGSAGGLGAFGQFFSHLPPDTGLAFVLVPHLEPTHKGMMPELLGRHTRMKVVEVEDGMEFQPNHVYVIPPNADLAILHGKPFLLSHVPGEAGRDGGPALLRDWSTAVGNSRLAATPGGHPYEEHTV